jgi:fatty-acyl-CoA synthase
MGAGQDNIYERDLDRNPANYQPLTPLSLLEWAESTYPDKTAVIHGTRSYTYREFGARCRRLASALAKRGVGQGDTVSVMAPNTPVLLEAHYGVPMLGAVLNAINTRLDADTVAFILEHAESKVLIADRELSPVVGPALEKLGREIIVIDHDDALAEGGELLGEKDYEALLEEGDPTHPIVLPEDEWQALSLCYTSGTTGNPKGVVYHHRGAYLNAVGNALVFGMNARSVYLWTLPMFHCNGWTYTWGVTAVGGTHVCLRKVDPDLIFPAIRDHGVTHMCGAPIVLNMLVHAPDEVKLAFDREIEDRGHGAHGLPRYAPLRADGILRPGDLLRLAGRMGRARPAGQVGEDGAAGRALPDAGRAVGARPGLHGAGARRRRDDRRDHAAGPHRHARLSEKPGCQRGGVPRRLVPHR